MLSKGLPVLSKADPFLLQRAPLQQKWAPLQRTSGFPLQENVVPFGEDRGPCRAFPPLFKTDPEFTRDSICNF